MAKSLQDVIARVEAAGAPADAEPAPVEASTGEASQTDGAAPTDAGSASADAPSPVGSSPAAEASPEATNPPDVDILRAKLEADRERRAAREERRRIREEQEAAQRARREAEEARDQWAKLGKEGSILETLKAAGRDPKEVFELMRQEAIKAGTPEAQIEKIQKAYDSELTTLKAQLKALADEREAERQAAIQQAEARAFVDDFKGALEVPDFAPLLDEYDPEDLFPLVRTMRDDPDLLFTSAQRLGIDLGVDLTDPEATFNINHIFKVLTAQQAAHRAKQEQRRQQRAASQPSQPTPQPAKAKAPTVNGTEARNAGTTIGNDLAASSAVAKPDHVGESHKDRLKRLERMFPGV